MKVGDKVVYIGGGATDTPIRYPKEKTEICVIIGSEMIRGDLHFSLEGYEFASDNTPQRFYVGHLRKIEPHTFKNELTAELAQEVKEPVPNRIEKPLRKVITN